MRHSEPTVALRRALQISLELVEIANSGDIGLTQRLDAERLQLLKSVRRESVPLSQEDRAMLGEIAALNERAIGFLEHRRRCKGRDLDMLSVGRRAVHAYAVAGRHRLI